MQKYKTIEEFLDALTGEKKSQVLKLRQYIKDSEPNLIEHIKWNAPSYVFKEEDRITFNTANKAGLVKLVFHMGALRKEDKKGKPVINDKFGIIEWASDIRGYITFKNLDDVKSKEKAIKQLVAGWLTVQ